MKKIKMEKMLSVLIVLMVFLYSAMPAFAEDESGELGNQMNTRAIVTVNDVSELQAAVAGAGSGDTITLSDTFVSGNIILPIPAADVTIEGNGQTWTLGTITVNGNAGGQLTIRNLQVDGTGVSGRLIQLQHQSGKVILDALTVSDGSAGAIQISAGTAAGVLIQKTKINNNTAVNTAPAVQISSSSNIEINDSTIENNTGTGGGYETGAISSKNFAGQLSINNTILRSNLNKTVNTGVIGGGGGAIAMHYMTGQMNIKESVFQNNETNGDGVSMASTYDGGAIYIFDARGGAVINIDSTTFDSNLAWDDGGAIMFQGTANPGLTTNITNSTFYNNRAYGLDGANVSGGAIQYFKNGGSSRMTNAIAGSTFVGNIAGNELTTLEQRGGAVALSGAGLLATAAVSRTNTLFIGNQVYGADGQINSASSYKDISNSTSAQAGNIINADKGSDPEYTASDVLGVGGATLVDNQSGITAGVDKEIVKTIPIKPDGIADNTSTSTVSGEDERGYERYKDIGAVEISWIKYDANGGTFNLSPMSTYDGSVYYELESDHTIQTYYEIGYIGKQGSVQSQAGLQAQRQDYELIGWSTDPNTDTPDPAYAFGQSLTYGGENQTLYAVWRTTTRYHVTYDANGGAGTAPTDSTDYLPDDTVTVQSKGNLEKENYTFAGWNTSANGDGTAYNPNEIFTINADMILYAQWSENAKYTVQYDGNGSTDGTAPIDTSSPYYADGAVVVLDQGSLAKENNIFTGWNTKSDGSGTSYAVDDTFTITGNMTLYAQWSENAKYTVSYDGNGNTDGTAPIDTSSPYYADGVAVVLEQGNLVKENYTFMGWNTKPDGSGTSYTVDDTFIITGNMTLYAQWSENAKYTVSYDGNGNTGGTSPIDTSNPYYADGAAVVLDQGNLVKENYTFSGWNTDPAGKGTAYAVNDTFVITEDITLYAQWSENGKFSVQYNGNGNTKGEVPKDTGSPYYSGAAVTVLDKGNLAKENYTFAGWNTSADGSGTSYAAEDVFTIAEHTILYAQWNENAKYTVQYDGNGNTYGTVPTDESSPYYAGAEVTVLGAGVLEREGYTFIGWNTKIDGTGLDYAIGDKFTIADHTKLYAKWQKKDLAEVPTIPDKPKPTPDKPKPTPDTPKPNPEKPIPGLEKPIPTPDKSKPTAEKPIPENASKGTAPATGDGSNTILFFSVLGVSLLTILVIAWRKWRKQI